MLRYRYTLSFRRNLSHVPLQRFLRPLAWLFAALLLAEITARVWVADHVVAPGESLRNPTPDRFWPEYTTCGSEADSRLAVLIGASQAIGPEYVDPADIYFTQLRDNLRIDLPELDFRNWSVSGIRADQVELLSRQAIRCGISELVLVLSPINFDQLRNFHPGGDATDILLLAGDPALWRLLRHSLTLERMDWSTFFGATLSRNLALVRSRQLVWDHVAEDLPRAHHRPLFGHQRHNDSLKSYAEMGIDLPERRVAANAVLPAGSINARQWAVTFERHRMPTFERVYQSLQRRLKRAGARLTWVWSATNVLGMHPDLQREARDLQRLLCDRIRGDGWTCVDLSESLENRHFRVGNIASHFNQAGHAEFARLMTPVLRDAFQRP